MQQIMVLIEQERQEFEQHPLMRFLRDGNIPPEERLAYAPYICHFAMTFGDINRYVLRDEQSTDRYQQIVNRHTEEDDHHWCWFLNDLEMLGLNPSSAFTDVMRFIWGEQGRHAREVGYSIIGYALRAAPVLRLVIVEALEATGNVWLTSTVHPCRALRDKYKLMYFDDYHLARETGHAIGTDREEVLSIQVPANLRPLAEEVVKVVFEKFAAFCTEVFEHTQTFVRSDAYPHFLKNRIKGGQTRTIEQ